MRPDQIDSLVREQGQYVFDRMFSAMEKVRERMDRACAALDTANVRYAIIGGNAVAAWVATRDEGAVRNTRDVDILLDPEDADAATVALAAVGFRREKTMDVTMFLDGPGGKPSQVIHVIWAGRKVRDDYKVAAPNIEQFREIDGKKIVDLLELTQMKLVEFRCIDKVHLRDMIGVRLIDESWLPSLEPHLATRLKELIDDPDG